MLFTLRGAVQVASKSLTLIGVAFLFSANAGSPSLGGGFGFNTGVDQGGIKADHSYLYVNLTSKDTIGTHYDTWTDPQGHTNVRYLGTGIVNYTQSWSCYEVFTSAWSFSPMGTDTRIYAVESSNFTYRSVSDDRNGSDYTSRFRAWIGPNTNYIDLKVQGYSSNYNGIDFALTVERFPSIASSNDCQISGVPFLITNTSTGYPYFIGTN